MNAWNAEHGNHSVNLTAGTPLGSPMMAIGRAGEMIGLPNLFSPLRYASSMVSVESFVGYRPIHTPDVLGNLVYGYAFKLTISFGVKELRYGMYDAGNQDPNKDEDHR